VDGFDLGPVGMPVPATPADAVASGAVAGTTAAQTTSIPTPAPTVAPPPDPDFVGPPSTFPAHRAIDERTAFLVVSMLRDVIKRGTGTPALVLKREDIGGKTGTTNDMRDAWFSGFGGHLVTTVWVGMDDFSSLGHAEFGARAALPIWIDYMRVALTDVPQRTFDPPQGIVTATINRSTGTLLPTGTPGGMEEYFKAEELTRFQNEAPGTADATTTNEDAFDIF
jgi:penicillin-binding protein 1A